MIQKVFIINHHGSRNVLEQVERELPDVAENEVMVKHTALGVNFMDYEQLRTIQAIQEKKSIIPGIEAVGVVEKCGSAVQSFKKGQRVGYVSLSGGGYTDYRVVKSSLLFPIPDVISDEAAALNLVKGITAHFLMRRTFFLRKDMNILIHGAASNIGKLMLRLAKAYKVHVIGTVGDNHKKNQILELGAKEAANYQEDFSEVVKNITHGTGVQVVYDFIGGDLMKRSLGCLTNFGLAVSAGSSSSRPAFIDPLLLTGKSLFLTAPRFHVYKKEKAELLMSIAEVFALINTGVFPPKADKIYSFDQIPEALNDIAARTGNSRVILL